MSADDLNVAIGDDDGYNSLEAQDRMRGRPSRNILNNKEVSDTERNKRRDESSEKLVCPILGADTLLPASAIVQPLHQPCALPAMLSDSLPSQAVTNYATLNYYVKVPSLLGNYVTGRPVTYLDLRTVCLTLQHALELAELGQMWITKKSDPLPITYLADDFVVIWLPFNNGMGGTVLRITLTVNMLIRCTLQTMYIKEGSLRSMVLADEHIIGLMLEIKGLLSKYFSPLSSKELVLTYERLLRHLGAPLKSALIEIMDDMQPGLLLGGKEEEIEWEEMPNGMFKINRDEIRKGMGIQEA
ncbi:uncharacterized protein PHACADRAFT_32452 [Phanerochaete carnosa HHB-10118-sp]|uniref:Uncharacterized protein n=1 Tax=Phanerochaete carnosa (strain HHB-10118-sp) TaxID=650164 RepID=K5VV08_PHACS|nr:uncharacterized protein PHACADRAFT_32452 [Phanerochaete carnosa HHB-10118-sp]EKM50399.1 hypothetical protein PHACADRAFT_32452 [Phanerochaete carnosa HHB-10118-sp]